MKLRKKGRQATTVTGWVLRGAVLAGAAYAVVRSFPELVRYLRIRRM